MLILHGLGFGERGFPKLVGPFTLNLMNNSGSCQDSVAAMAHGCKAFIESLDLQQCLSTNDSWFCDVLRVERYLGVLTEKQ